MNTNHTSNRMHEGNDDDPTKALLLHSSDGREYRNITFHFVSLSTLKKQVKIDSVVTFLRD